MILTKKTSTIKQQREFALLVGVRFACLLSSSEQPMRDQRVQSRLEKLQQHLFAQNFTSTFANQYLDRFGELGQSFALKVCPHTLNAEVVRIENNNVQPLAV